MPARSRSDSARPLARSPGDHPGRSSHCSTTCRTAPARAPPRSASSRASHGRAVTLGDHRDPPVGQVARRPHQAELQCPATASTSGTRRPARSPRTQRGEADACRAVSSRSHSRATATRPAQGRMGRPGRCHAPPGPAPARGYARRWKEVGAMSVVDNAIYVDGRRKLAPALARHRVRARCAAARTTAAASAGSACCARPGRDRGRRRRVRPARAGRRGHRQRPPAAQAGALRRHDLRRAAPGPLRRPGRGDRARRGAPVPRAGVRDHRPARRRAGPRRGPPVPRGGPGAARARPVRGALRVLDQVVDDYVPGARRPAGRHRRDRGAGLRRRRRPCRSGSTSSPARSSSSSARSSRCATSSPSCAGGSARTASDTDLELRRRMRDVEDHATRVLERIENFRELLTNILTVQRHAGRAAAERGDGPADRGGLRAERAGQADLLVGGHPVRADPGRRRSTG